jgi:hypothetical protein
MEKQEGDLSDKYLSLTLSSTVVNISLWPRLRLTKNLTIEPLAEIKKK